LRVECASSTFGRKFQDFRLATLPRRDGGLHAPTRRTHTAARPRPCTDGLPAPRFLWNCAAPEARRFQLALTRDGPGAGTGLWPKDGPLILTFTFSSGAGAGAGAIVTFKKNLFLFALSVCMQRNDTPLPHTYTHETRASTEECRDLPTHIVHHVLCTGRRRAPPTHRGPTVLSGNSCRLREPTNLVTMLTGVLTKSIVVPVGAGPCRPVVHCASSLIASPHDAWAGRNRRAVGTCQRQATLGASRRGRAASTPRGRSARAGPPSDGNGGGGGGDGGAEGMGGEGGEMKDTNVLYERMKVDPTSH